MFLYRNDRLLHHYRKHVHIINTYIERYQTQNSSFLYDRLRYLEDVLDKTPTSFSLIQDEALAIACLGSQRTLHLMPYDEQKIGALILLDNKIAEMKTGEGKTLTAGLAAFVRSLEKKGVHVVTVNDYLAERDGAFIRPVFEYFQKTVGVVTSSVSDQDKQHQYACDVTYATNHEIGFDYLRDNMILQSSEKKMRGLHFALIDEIDSILIDEARTPLVISGPSLENPNIYTTMNELALSLQEQQNDFSLDLKNKQIVLSEKGLEKSEKFLITQGLLSENDSLYSAQNLFLMYHLQAALRAQYLFQLNIDYLIQDNQICIVDEFTGRLQKGRRWSEGVHQAIEEKEHLPVQPENQIVASITLQNLFRTYTHISGMTGTALTEATEFMDIYHLEVVEVPTHKPMIRHDKPDLVFLSHSSKLQHILHDVLRIHQTQQPILIGTSSVESSEEISSLLQKENIPHHVLNAKYHEQEAQIIAQSGKLGAITIATHMAGRGTDILLGGSKDHLSPLEKELSSLDTLLSHTSSTEDKEQLQQQREIVFNTYTKELQTWQNEHEQVIQKGGLYILGTERHESRRIDNQLRGRSGRQGDPGTSQFYVSFDDPLMKIFASDFAQKTLRTLGMSEQDNLNLPFLSKQIEKAQHRIEQHNFDIRKSLLDYDDVIHEQRQAYYQWRNSLLNSNTTVFDYVEYILQNVIATSMDNHNLTLNNDITEQHRLHIYHDLHLPSSVSQKIEKQLPPSLLSSDIFSEILYTTIIDYLEHTPLYQHEQPLWLQKVISLILISHDLAWREHLVSLNFLRKGIHLRGYAQKQPKQEYKSDAFNLFKAMINTAQQDTFQALLNLKTLPSVDEVSSPTPQKSSSVLIDFSKLSFTPKTQLSVPLWNQQTSWIFKSPDLSFFDFYKGHTFLFFQTHL